MKLSVKQVPLGAPILFMLALVGLACVPVFAEEAPTGVPTFLITEGPVDDTEYMVGPGDGFSVTILGQAQQSWQVPVTPEGTIIVPPAGAIQVAEMTLREAKTRVKSVLSKYYQNVGIEIALVELRRFEIHVLGQVTNPGTYIVTAVTRVSSAVDLAGGFLEGGSRRRTVIRGRDGNTEYADVLRFEMLGEREGNPFVTDGDLVYVPVKLEEASVYGQVALPGRYEIVEGESIGDFIRIAGGFADNAVLDSVEVQRFLPEDPSRTFRFFVDFRRGADAPEDAELHIQSGDEIFVRGIPQWHLHRGVEVSGEVRYPGVYVIEEGAEKLSELIERAGGFTEDADLFEATVTRTSFRSEALDREFERLRNMPVSDMTDDEYAYFKMRSREKKDEVVVDFVSLFQDGNEAKDIIMRRGDTINIPQVSRTITVSGQVLNPGRLPFQEGENYRFYIDRAGGFARRASHGSVRIIKGSTGIWFDKGKTKLEPGDTIWIPEKPDRDYWALFKDFMTVAAQVATVYLVVDTASR